MKTVFSMILLFSLSAFSETMIFETVEPSTKVSLKTIRLANSAWTESAIRHELANTNHIFAKCGIQIQKLELSDSNVSAVISSFDELEKQSTEWIRTGQRLALEPTLILAGDPDGEVLAGVQGRPAGVSFAKISGEGSDLENVAIAFDFSHTDYHAKLVPEGYSTIAHELAHVYLNSDHVRYPNLLATGPLVSPGLSKEQCEIFRQSPLLKR